MLYIPNLIIFWFQKRGPSKFEDGYEGWVWEIKGEGGMLAAVIFPVKPMWGKWAHHSLDVDGLRMAEWTIMLFCGIMTPEFYGDYVPWYSFLFQ